MSSSGVKREESQDRDGIKSLFSNFIQSRLNKKFMDLPYSSNRLLVRLKLHRLIHIRLPVFDEAVVIACHHPGVVV